MALDIYSLLFGNMVVNFIALLAFFIIYLDNRTRYKGLELLLLNILFQVLGITFILSRPIFGNFVALVLGNTFILASCTALIGGFQLYLQTRLKYKLNIIILLIFMLTSIWFTEVSFNGAAREIILAFCIMFYEVQLIALLFKSHKNVVLPGSAFMIVAFSGYFITSFIRLVSNILFLLNFITVSQNDLIDAITVIVYSALSILVTIGIILLITRRLVYDVQRQEIIYKTAFHSAPYGLVMSELINGKIISTNEGFRNITGYESEECLGRSTNDLNLWQTASDKAEIDKLISDNNKIISREIVLRKKNGAQIIGLLSCEIANLPEGKMLVSNIADVTELAEAKKELKEKAIYDFLTKLPNRYLFYERFKLAKAQADRNNTRIAIMSLDLDKFKEVNDLYGHDVGDKVLVEISERLIKCIRKTDTAARFGGDEFVLLIQEVNANDDAIEVAAKIIELAKEAIVHNGLSHGVGLSIGIAFYPEDGILINELLKKSDAALYQSKNNGRNRWTISNEN